jgi:hypothetical protein
MFKVDNERSEFEVSESVQRKSFLKMAARRQVVKKRLALGGKRGSWSYAESGTGAGAPFLSVQSDKGRQEQFCY